MSAQTWQALADAIQAHLDDESAADGTGPQLLTDWFLLAAHAGADPASTGYKHVYSDSPVHSLLGLAQLAPRWLADYIDSEEEGD